MFFTCWFHLYSWFFQDVLRELYSRGCPSVHEEGFGTYASSVKMYIKFFTTEAASRFSVELRSCTLRTRTLLWERLLNRVMDRENFENLFRASLLVNCMCRRFSATAVVKIVSWLVLISNGLGPGICLNVLGTFLARLGPYHCFLMIWSTSPTPGFSA